MHGNVNFLFQVHYPPYLFECFLFGPVHDMESAAEIGDGAVVFKLRKVDAVLWPSLQSAGIGKLFFYLFINAFRCCLAITCFIGNLNHLQNCRIQKLIQCEEKLCMCFL